MSAESKVYKTLVPVDQTVMDYFIYNDPTADEGFYQLQYLVVEPGEPLKGKHTQFGVLDIHTGQIHAGSSTNAPTLKEGTPINIYTKNGIGNETGLAFISQILNLVKR